MSVVFLSRDANIPAQSRVKRFISTIGSKGQGEKVRTTAKSSYILYATNFTFNSLSNVHAGAPQKI